MGGVAGRPLPGGTCPKTLDASLAQVTVGLAWHYRKYAGEGGGALAGGGAGGAVGVEEGEVREGSLPH